MRTRNTHRRLLVLLCVVMGAGLGLLAGCSALLPGQKGAAVFESSDQAAESFDQIVPGMTRADDLPGQGFDTAKADVLSARDAGQRLGSADPAVRACIHAGIYCTGFVFHAAPTGLLQRVSHGARRPDDIILLVMNGRVVHKVFSGNPRTENWDDKRQPLGPLQDLGGAVARQAGSVSSF